MQLRYTPHQVPRGARADAEKGNKIYLIKKVRSLRATYQVRLLALRARQEGRVLVLMVPKGCTYHPSLKLLVHQFRDVFRREVL